MATTFVRTLALRQKSFLTTSQSIVHCCKGLHTSHDERHKELSKREFWKNKYKELTETFDWFLPEEIVSSLVCYSLLNVASRKNFSETSDSMHRRAHPVNVLDLGCGKSVLPMRFYEWTPFPVAMHCLDYIQEAVDFQLKTLRESRPGHRRTYVCGVCASVCSIPYQSDLFHVITDKGTMDALLKDPTDGGSQARSMLTEVERVLQKGGLFMQVTDEDPDSRMYFLETNSPSACQWKFSIFTDSGSSEKECFVYSFCK